MRKVIMSVDFTILQANIPDLGSIGLNIAAWLLVVLAIVVSTFLWNVLRKLDNRITQVENQIIEQRIQAQENKNRLDSYHVIIDELRRYTKEIHNLVRKDIEPRLRDEEAKNKNKKE